MTTLTEATTRQVFGIIPARWASTRFPGKMLHLIQGKPLIQHVWERVQDCTKLDKIIIATDHEPLAKKAHEFGAETIMTSAKHPSGSDRLAEAIQHFPEASHIINIQGDEPQIEPSLIDELALALLKNPEISMATAANVITEEALIKDPNVVKCVLNQQGEALYFSRSPLPYARNPHPSLNYYRHKGIYAYRRDFLEQYVQWQPTPLEQAESLEQLRALENGARIKVIITKDTSGGIDTPEQAEALEKFLQEKSI